MARGERDREWTARREFGVEERVWSDLFSSHAFLNIGMDFLSEQEVEAVPTFASEGEETSTREGTSEGRAVADAYSTPTEKGGQALMFESRRQQEESSEDVSYNLLVMGGKRKKELRRV